MSLHRLIFDSTAPAESANVGAWLRDASGNLLTSTLVGSNQALDINLVQSVDLVVTATDLDIRNLVHTQDSVKVGDGTDFLAVNADGSINSVVTATDLDIRNLAQATDSVSIGNGTALFTSTTVGPKIALDVNIAGSDIEINVENDWANIALTTAASSVSTTGALFASPLANRRFVWMYNNGSKVVYLGPSGVTTANGFPIFPGSLLEARIGPSVAVHAVAQSGTQEVRVMQAS